MSRAGESSDYGRVALDFVDSLQNLRTRREVLVAAETALNAFGFEHYAIVDVPFQNTTDITVLGMKAPIGWIELYVAERYQNVDPVIMVSRLAAKPFEWGEMRTLAPRGASQSEFMSRARDFGLVHGFTLPVQNLNGRTSIFSMSSGRPPFVNRFTKPAIHLMALYALERLREIESDPVDSCKPLTGREKEVLAWAAAGKSASAIADQLGITERTAIAHTVNATQKLGAKNKTQAVAIAIQRRLIQL